LPLKRKHKREATPHEAFPLEDPFSKGH
jgi:hypothetical protein